MPLGFDPSPAGVDVFSVVVVVDSLLLSEPELLQLAVVNKAATIIRFKKILAIVVDFATRRAGQGLETKLVQ